MNTLERELNEMEDRVEQLEEQQLDLITAARWAVEAYEEGPDGLGNHEIRDLNAAIAKCNPPKVVSRSLDDQETDLMKRLHEVRNQLAEVRHERLSRVMAEERAKVTTHLNWEMRRVVTKEEGPERTIQHRTRGIYAHSRWTNQTYLIVLHRETNRPVAWQLRAHHCSSTGTIRVDAYWEVDTPVVQSIMELKGFLEQRVVTVLASSTQAHIQ